MNDDQAQNPKGTQQEPTNTQGDGAPAVPKLFTKKPTLNLPKITKSGDKPAKPSGSLFTKKPATGGNPFMRSGPTFGAKPAAPPAQAPTAPTPTPTPAPTHAPAAAPAHADDVLLPEETNAESHALDHGPSTDVLDRDLVQQAILDRIGEEERADLPLDDDGPSTLDDEAGAAIISAVALENDALNFSPPVAAPRAPQHDFEIPIEHGELGDDMTEMELDDEDLAEDPELAHAWPEPTATPPAEATEEMSRADMIARLGNESFQNAPADHTGDDFEVEEPTALFDAESISDPEELPEDFDEEDATQAISLSGAPAFEQDRHPTTAPQQHAPQQHAPQQHAQHAPAQPAPQQQAWAPQADPAPALDDDFTDQKTEVIQSPFERDLVVPKLRVIEGPDAGQEFFINGLRATVGRGENNSIMIADLSMSRNHFELIKNSDDSIMLRDLGSANGTLLNGAPVKEATLFHTDRVEAGKSVLEYHNEASPPRANRHYIPVAGQTITDSLGGDSLDEGTRLVAMQLDQSAQFFTRVSIFAGVLCVPLCVLLLVVSSGVGKTEPAAPETAIAQPANAAADFYMKGVEAVRERSWDQARGFFEQANQADPQVDITSQLDRIEREEAAADVLARAHKAKDGAEVAALIARIPESSTYYEEAHRLTKTERRNEVSDLYQRALEAFDKDDLETTEGLIASIQKKVPEHAGATELAAKVTTRKAELEEAAKKEQEAARQDANADDVFGSTTTDAAPSASLDNGYQLYKTKNFNDAAAFFAGVGTKKANGLANDARTVKSQWSKGSKALKSNQASAAVTALEKARRSDKRLKGFHRGAIQRELGEAYGKLGLAHLKKKKYRDARKALSSGKKASSKAASVRKLDQELERAATSLYIQAANKKKSDPAAATKLCRTIMLMVPPSSPTFKKARKLILEL